VEDLNSEVPSIWNDTKRRSYHGIYSAFGYMGVITSVDEIIGRIHIITKYWTKPSRKSMGLFIGW
tara:strand:+ start:1089 stop:1283 length:195 start_codon:yes stop_codon:yes gene_type:complete